MIFVLLFGRLGFAYAVVSTTSLPAAKDTSIRSDNNIRNYGADNQIRVESRLRRGQLRMRRGLIEFDVSSVPADAVIERAELRLYLERERGGGLQSLHRITQSWREGTGQGDNNNPNVNGATWLERQFGNNRWTGTQPWDWMTRGGDFIGASSASTPTIQNQGWMNWNVTGDVGAWTAGSIPNFGWLIKDSNEGSGVRREARYTSKEGNPNRRPALDVTYLRSASAVSTNTVNVGWYGQMSARIANTGGPGGDQINQISFVIPPGWGRISTSTADYSIAAPNGKVWNVTVAPMGPNGPQTVTVAAASGLDDLADGEIITVTFNAEAPWLSGPSNLAFTSFGAGGGAHIPAVGVINVVGGGPLDFWSSVDTSMSQTVLSGLDTTSTGTLGSIRVRDARGSGNGWNVSVSASAFRLTTDSNVTISADNFSIPVAPPVNILGGNNPPATAAGSLAGAGLTLLDAPVGVGMGDYEVRPDLRLLVPAETFRGTYAATVTETIVAL